ncbi:MAG: DUF480 domain-containing protein [Planctomycetaceae bacterium]
MNDPGLDSQLPPITALSKKQRRVLGTLIEKALTVPDSYPLTINSLISGCNQKSNRAPLTNFDDSDIEDTINELIDLGLVASVHTDGARTEKYRHYVRRRFTLSEPQVGILAELLLRGRQAVGELRTRASRMTPKGSLETQEQLRTELQGLLSQKLIQADGPLDRRGVEVDHNLYLPQEGQALAYREGEPDEAAPAPAPRPAVAMAGGTPGGPAPMVAARPPVPGGVSTGGAGMVSEAALDELRRGQAELRQQLEDLRRQLGEVADVVDRLQRDLGV